MVYASATIAFLVTSLIVQPSANAYLDPGTGSYILQIIVAGILSSLYFIKLYWIRINAYFYHIFSKKTDGALNTTAPNPPTGPLTPEATTDSQHPG